MSVTVAIVGNPNTGKSTLFNVLAGVRQRVGNYPGVTVEKKVGHLELNGQRFALVDLPGTYSIAPRSPDEMVTVDVLLGRQADVPPPDAVLCIVDASNLERNLYLVSQVLELGRPVVVALNMIDLARDQGVAIDVERLRRQLGVPVIEVQANRRIGIEDLKKALLECVGRQVTALKSPLPEAFHQEATALETALNGDRDAAKVGGTATAAVPRYLVERMLLDTGGFLEEHGLSGGNGHMRSLLVAARERLAQAGCTVPAVEALSRYEWIGRILDGVVSRPSERRVTATDRIDRLVTHKVWGTLIFAALMLIVFQSVFRWAEPLMDLISDGKDAVAHAVESVVPPGALQSLLADGVVGGVGSVLVFLPQILILFFFIAVLEDCGYMARAAYLMDKLMVRVGLSGKSFIPLLSSFACAIPGVMATRVIENRRDRLTTILVAPLMSCSARLPVYTLLIAAFIPGTTYVGGLLTLQGVTMFAMYLVGIVTAVVVALLLKKTLLRGATPPFVMELPSYKWPSVRTVLHRMLERGWAFVYRAGTVIFAVTVLVWAAAYYPHNSTVVEAPFAQQREALETQRKALDAKNPADEARLKEVDDKLTDLDNQLAGAYQRQSYLGRMGQAVEPVVRPLGWDWRIGCAVIASFPAREVVVGTLGVIYNLGRGVDEESESLRDTLRGATRDGREEKVFNVPVALSIMVFFALCAQCASTLAVIKRETNSWGWPAFTFVYMTTLAYVAAWATYQMGMLF